MISLEGSVQVTVTLLAPVVEFGGAMQVIAVEDMTTTPVHGVLLEVTEQPVAKPAPCSMRVLPPAVVTMVSEDR